MNQSYGIYAAYAGLLAVLSLVQISFGHFISISDVAPDFVLLGVIFIALRSGQLTATIAGFIAGLALDLAIGEVVGLGALAKTCAGFTAGYFFQIDMRDAILRSPRFISYTALVALLHNIVYLLAHFHRPDADIIPIVLRFAIGGVAYTAVFAAIAMLIMMRTGTRVKVSS
jgi:rod shape-determining protein MreD